MQFDKQKDVSVLLILTSEKKKKKKKKNSIMKSLITKKIRTPKGKENGNSKHLFVLQLIDQLTLVRLKYAAA